MNHSSALLFNETLMMIGDETVTLPLEPNCHQNSNNAYGYTNDNFS